MQLDYHDQIGEIEGLKKRVEHQQQDITGYKYDIERRDKTNGELMDTIQCQKERIKELEEEVQAYHKQEGETRCKNLDLAKALAAKQDEIRQLREEIGRLHTINEAPTSNNRLAAALIEYIEDRVDDAIEARYND